MDKTLPDCGRCNTWDIEDASAHADETGHFPIRCEPTAHFPEDDALGKALANLDKIVRDFNRAIDALLAAYRGESETRTCAAAIFIGSPNPDSPLFGPTEYCDEPTEPGQDYCPAHLPWSER